MPVDLGRLRSLADAVRDRSVRSLATPRRPVLARVNFPGLLDFDPNQPRDRKGRWTDGPASLAIDAFEQLYTAIVDEARGGDLVVSVHENGDFVLAHLGDDGNRTVLFDALTPDIARSVAGGLEWATSQDIPGDAENDPGTHLLDWEYFEDDIIVGFDTAGDVSLRFPRSDDADPSELDDFDVYDMSAEDAVDLGEALRDMADRREELDGADDASTLKTAFMHSVDHVVDLAAAVDDLRRGRRSERSRISLTGGASGSGVDLVELDDGTKLIHKVPASWANVADEVDAEQLASLVYSRFGVPVAGVYRDEQGATWSAYVPGKTLGELDENGGRGGSATERFLASRESVRMGFVDMLIGNSDRNDGNLIVGADGSVTGIDHSYGFIMLGLVNKGGTDLPAPGDLGPPEGRPVSHFVSRGSGVLTKFVNNPLTEADVEKARTILEDLRPDFDKLGRGAWLDKSLEMLEELDTWGNGEDGEDLLS